LPPDGGDLTLFAEGFQIDPSLAAPGCFYLQVDGRARAFIFRTAYAPDGAPSVPRLMDTPAVRVHCAPFAAAAPKFRPSVEVDNPPPGARLLVSIGQPSAVDAQQEFSPARDDRIGLRVLPGPESGLQFEASSRDPVAEFDASGVSGRRAVIAQLLGRANEELARATAFVVFDGTPPRSLRWTDIPTQAKKGTAVALGIAADDPETGVKEVRFFLGVPVDGKLPPGAQTVAAKYQETSARWLAKLTLPEKAGTVDVTAQLVNFAGLTAFASEAVEVVETDAPTVGGIILTVVEGDRPQADVEVRLTDATGKEMGSQKTDKDGVAKFRDLAPGKYNATGAKESSQTSGRQSIVVSAGGESPARLSLYR
jgi:hypothetical protein